MKTIFFAYSEDVGEVEGMFDEDGNLLGMWACNDASWSNEYFAGFMKNLGINVVPATGWLISKLERLAKERWG